jgi:hypothetical protein
VRAQETVLAGSRMPYREWLTATDAEDPLWRPMRLGQALERVNVPVLLQEGWQDRFVDQMIEQTRIRPRALTSRHLGGRSFMERAVSRALAVSTRRRARHRELPVDAPRTTDSAGSSPVIGSAWLWTILQPSPLHRKMVVTPNETGSTARSRDSRTRLASPFDE